MEIDSKNTANLTTTDQREIPNKSSNTPKKVNFDTKYINNGYSTIKIGVLNNHIGILQIAHNTIKDILNSNSLVEIISLLSNAKLFNKSIFAERQNIKDSSGNIIFYANRILDIIPDDDRDIAIFKKSLKVLKE